MKKRIILVIIFIAYSESIFATKQPNIVVILSDDVGFEEYGMFGVREGASNTPNIDKLSQEGVAFKNTYAYYSF